MAQNKINKLELTWIGKEDEPLAIEPRLLLDTPEYSFGEVETDTLPNGKPWPGNMLIHGDNLLALRALEENFKGAVKCIYIDPPYNTGNAFEHYDDSMEHSIWLSLMQRRIQLLYNLLTQDGIMFINLDENEHAYCKIICDEIFGRSNYVGDLIWQKRKGGGNDSRYFAIDHDYILVYAKNKSKDVHQRWYVSQSEDYQKRYKEVDENGNRYFWDTVARNGLKNAIPVKINCPDGSVLKINSQKSQATIEDGLKNGMVRLARSKNGWTLHHRVYMSGKQVLRSILTDVGTNKSAGDESVALFGNNPFDYPKPEALISKILELTTKPGDIVLDSFLGSGTTAAVAHKMGRRWIGVELGDHAYTHCAVRLRKVIDGEQGGISKSQNWQGGGGFKFYELAPSLLNKDKYGNLVINIRSIMPICLPLLWLSIRASPTRPTLKCIGSRAIAQNTTSYLQPPNSLPLKYSKPFTTSWTKMNRCLSAAPNSSRSVATSSRISPSRKSPKFSSTPASSTTTTTPSTSCQYPPSTMRNGMGQIQRIMSILMIIHLLTNLIYLIDE